MTWGTLLGILAGVALGNWLIWRRERRRVQRARLEIMRRFPEMVRDDLDHYFTTLPGAEEAEAWLTKKMTPYEAGEDGPLCQRCLHRWCPGDCPQEEVGA